MNTEAANGNAGVLVVVVIVFLVGLAIYEYRHNAKFHAKLDAMEASLAALFKGKP